MLLYYVNGTERSADIRANTLRITNQIQQRTDNASFSIFQGTKPSENQDVKIFAAAKISSANSVLESWLYRFKITPTAVNGVLYFSLANAPAAFWTHVRSDGGDIRVTTSDGITQVAREVVNFSVAGQTGALFLATSGSTSFYVYYGNSVATEPAVGSTYGRNNVWSSYEAVWHLSETSGTTVTNSTGNASNNGTIKVSASGYYPFDGNANDFSTAGRNGTVNGATLTTDRFGNANSAYYFDGINDSISIADYSVSSSLFYSAIINLDDVVGTKPIIDKDVQFQVVGNKLRVAWNDGSPQSVDSATTLSASTNYHVVLWWDGTTARMYINGVIDANTATFSTITGYAPAATYIGRDGAAGSNYFKGKIDEVLIKITPPSSATSMAQAIGLLYTLQQSHDLNKPSVAGGKVGRGFDFWGIGLGGGFGVNIDCGTTIGTNLANNHAFTLLTWAYRYSAASVGNGGIIGGFYGGNFRGPYTSLGNTTVGYTVGLGPSVNRSASATVTPNPLANYTRVGLTYDGSDTIKLIANGVVVNTFNPSSVADTVDNGSGQQFRIGRNPWDDNGWFNGILDEFYVLGTAMSDTELANEYANQSSVSTFWTVTAEETLSGDPLTYVYLKDSYQTNVNRFYAGQRIHVRIGAADEVVTTVYAYNETTRLLTINGDYSDIVEDDYIGSLIFGGIVSVVADANLETLSVIDYQVTAVDYTKIFDKKLVSDTWENVDSRYIINDFVNTTVNYNRTLDNMDYADNTAIQAEWIESGDGSNPTVDSSDFMEGDASAVLSWTYSTGTALWSATPSSQDFSALMGVSSGTPTGGEFMAQLKSSSLANITSIKLRIGSDASNYAAVTLEPVDSTDWQYVMVKMTNAAITGTPNWTAVDYAAVEVVATGSGTIRLNGLRINQTNSFTLFNVQSTNEFDDFRSPQLKPSALVNLLAKTFEYVWYIDYERDIHFAPRETTAAPYEITDTSDNFTELGIEVDASQIGNRVVVRGGEKTSASRYSQVFEGNGISREWILKSKFNDLEVYIDDNTSTFTADATTNTTTIKETAHGLSTGDHIVNRTRSNAVRQVTVVDADTLTVETVTGQTAGDTISKFATAQTLGVEGLTDEATVDYVANSNEKSVRATANETTLPTGTFIRMEYNERLPIQVQYTDTTSANALRLLGYGDGVFDLDPITDRNIKDTDTALALARAKVREFANAVVTGDFKTDQEGLRAGQLLHISETTIRNIDSYYVIQTVTMRQVAGEFKDYFEISVSFGTTLFGWIEFMQKLLAMKDGIEVNADDIVETFVTSDDEVQTVESSSVALGGFKRATQAETVETTDDNTVTRTTGWQWETSVGQTLPTRWNLFEWG